MNVIYQPQKQILQSLLKSSSTHSSQLLYIVPSRSFSEKVESNVLKGQNMRYIPKKRLQFDFISAEGPLNLVFQASDAFYKRINNWKLSTAIATPAAAFAYYSFGLTYWWAYPMLFLPTMYHLYDYTQLKHSMFKVEVYRMWLYQNGDQILVETFDKCLHRLNIINNQEHEIVENKDHLLFVINNSGREYLLANKNCPKIDYDLMDRIMKGVCIDTLKFQKLYNRLIYRQVPMNLRPTVFNRYIPQSTSINSNKSIWKILNRTIYRSDDPNWLRNNTKELDIKNLTQSQRDTLTKLQDKHGFKFIYPEELFYKTHKISRQDFLNKLEQAKSDQERQAMISQLYEDEAKQGRRGVVELERAHRIIHGKVEQRDKFVKFVQKFGKGEDAQSIKVNIQSFKDLA